MKTLTRIRSGTLPLAAAALMVLSLLGSGLTACGGGDDDFDAATFCRNQSELDSVFDNIGEGADAMEKASASVNDLVNSGPPEIKDDLNTIRDVFNSLKDVAVEAEDLMESDPEAAMQMLGEALGNFDEAEIEAAGSRVDSWVESNC